MLNLYKYYISCIKKKKKKYCKIENFLDEINLCSNFIFDIIGLYNNS